MFWNVLEGIAYLVYLLVVFSIVAGAVMVGAAWVLGGI